MSLETFDITEGNWYFRKKIVKKADIDPITLSRGVTFWDSDFYRWSMASITGDPTGFQARNVPSLSIGGVTPRRNLLLIHFFARYPGLAAAAAATGVLGGSGALTGVGGPTTVGIGASATAGVLSASVGINFGPFEFAPRIPAKAWLLHDCVLTRFKSGSDFDASSGDVSIAEIDIQPEMIEEISLAG